MPEQEAGSTLSRVQRQIDQIKNADSAEHARIARHICSGYLLALYLERLISGAEHRTLDEASMRALEQWLPPAERERFD